MRKLTLLLGIAVAAGAVASNGREVMKDRLDCLTVNRVGSCARWEKLDPKASRAYWVNVHTSNGWSVEALADYWGVDNEKVARLDMSLLSNEAVDSVERFNPYAVDFANVKALKRSRKLSHGQKQKWLSYRHTELGV